MPSWSPFIGILFDESLWSSELMELDSDVFDLCTLRSLLLHIPSIQYPRTARLG
jgi:hypothetical protein